MFDRDLLIKVKLVVIVKDECVYLVDWIFYYLYVGFVEIEIYINRICDKSVELFEELSVFDLRISWDCFDFVDMVLGSVYIKM